MKTKLKPKPRTMRKIPEYLLDKFDEEFEGIRWGEISIRATFQDGKPIFFFDKHTSEKYTEVKTN